ncbi:pentatricopeptide repeat-containing protein At1g43980, mitochondrial [Coffea eugenioides]|uniref:pentatricopeptide repeat-containing protein At1g43980, mitochondrial n=1 Tax=Coffea eugenioides TaxID=49369 RepID=UPI000F609DED|nr:pentatricopeptide repeat-containing protein At1g43980, mitochondrial [Coffea eugenioides]
MYLLLQRLCRHRSIHTYSLSFYTKLIDQCLRWKRPNFAKSIHAQLIKLGFNGTFLGNRCVDMYSKVGLFNYALKVFGDIADRNVYSWNICLKTYAQHGDFEKARLIFDKMPERDVVSWNSMISGYVSCGFSEQALELFLDMQKNGVRPSGFTFSILISSVECVFAGKQIHCSMLRNGVGFSNVVVGNSLIDMYGKVGVVEYALSVFWSMKEVDVISWNSLISACCKSGYEELAIDVFCWMRYQGYAPDEFTVSRVISACSGSRNLEKGKPILCLCIKMGFFSNTILLSAAIDYLSKCNRMEDSVHIFEESSIWDSALCNSMISAYSQHGVEGKAFGIFVVSIRENIRPTEFTLSSVLNCASAFLALEQGSQVHSLVIKSGFESDSIVSSSLVDMYFRFGLVDAALGIFATMVVKDLIAWNTVIMGLAHNGKFLESIGLFKQLKSRGLVPDKITFSGALLACRYGGLLEEGMAIFSLMEKDYGIAPRDEHYACVVDLMSRAGKLKEAIAIMEVMPHPPNALMWESILCACRIYGDLKLVEKVAERMIDLKIESLLSCSVLAQVYEHNGRWESLVRVRRFMKQKYEVFDSSWVGFGGNVYAFETNETFHQGGEDIYSLLRLLTLETQDQVYL